MPPVQTRSERPWSFDPADFDRPERHDPAWRFAALDRLAPLLDASGVAERVAESEFHPDDLIAAIELQRAEPTVVAGDGVVVQERRDGGARAENVRIEVADGAELTLVTVVDLEPGGVYAASHQATVGARGRLTHILVSLGGGVARVNTSVRLAGEGAAADLYGLAFAQPGDHLESNVYLHHEGPRTTGNVLYKSVLQGAGARVAWIGDVLIGPNAVGTDTYEANRNLVLTEGARADSIPNLEIQTGDIAGAGHASATGRFDEEQLFYLRARGIPEAEARRLVVAGFLTEIVDRVPDEALRERLSAAIAERLG